MRDGWNLPSAVAVAAAVALSSQAAHGQSHRRPPPSVRWTVRTGQPTRIEVFTVQQTAAPAIAECARQEPAPSGFQLTVVFDTSGRIVWTSADTATRVFPHCVATAARRTMALTRFQGTEMIRIVFPIAGTHW